jgi:hypothetical protein
MNSILTTILTVIGIAAVIGIIVATITEKMRNN